MAKSTDSKKSPELSFESAMQQLTEIVAAMESDQLPLEDLIVRYEEGTKLVQICADKLKTAERKIEIITRSAQGKPATAPFEPESQSDPAPDSAPSTRKSSAPIDTDISLF